MQLTLQAAYPSLAMQNSATWDLGQLCVKYRTPTDTDNDQRLHLTSREVQEWADKNDTHWPYRLPYGHPSPDFDGANGKDEGT